MNPRSQNFTRNLRTLEETIEYVNLYLGTNLRTISESTAEPQNDVINIGTLDKNNIESNQNSNTIRIVLNVNLTSSQESKLYNKPVLESYNIRIKHFLSLERPN